MEQQDEIVLFEMSEKFSTGERTMRVIAYRIPEKAGRQYVFKSQPPSGVYSICGYAYEDGYLFRLEIIDNGKPVKVYETVAPPEQLYAALGTNLADFLEARLERTLEQEDLIDGTAAVIRKAGNGK